MKLNSDVEKELFKSAIQQLKFAQMTKIENALAWLYVKSWEDFGQHVLDEEELWNFGVTDFQYAFNGVFQQNKNDETQITKELKDLIMARFGNSKPDFFDWSQAIYSQVLTLLTLPHIINNNKVVEDTEHKGLTNQFSKIRTDITDQSAIAFRATAVASSLVNKRLTEVVWKNIRYNHGNVFNGSWFTAPVEGIYLFNATVFYESFDYAELILGQTPGRINDRLELQKSDHSRRFKDLKGEGSFSFTATLHLKKGYEVSVFVLGDLSKLHDPSAYYFEGRLLRRLD